jgi:hypothetical protein
MAKEWESEPDFIAFEAFGFKCEVKRHHDMGHLCGYVCLPEGYSLSGKSYDEIDATVHGGLTYNNNGKIGFDCSHFGDYMPGLVKILSDMGRPIKFYESEDYRDMGYVIRETYKLARQLSEA